MDFKELIRRLDDCGEFDGDLLDATAIETLLAERDAMKKDLKYGGCDTCRHKKEKLFNHPCRKCYQETGYFNRYSWRGPTPPDRQQTES